VRSIYWQDNIDPCGETAGEVEDYTIRIEENPNVSVTEIATITSRISPIPSYGTFTVTLASVAKQALVSVIDINGKEVYSQSFQSTAEMTLQTELAPGTYLVKVSTEKGASTQKLVVK
ncbi:T9SS type A sorting domain-containing protein, partial [Bacteroidia bacterium]|nr:T9SS type A sorting domain-containing protein [Bacteroidia bacterium]